MDIFTIVFAILIIFCIGLYAFTRTSIPFISSPEFLKFQKKYLLVYLLATGGDWLQGPHVYALYDSLGMNAYQIRILFVAGFGSSMVFGTIIGSIADKFGRKSNCLLYGVLYGASCITKHSPDFWVQFVGRLLAGVATSILYSAFESWLVNEHNKRDFDSESLGHTFSLTTLGNSIVAILAGLVAQTFADMYGFVAPFDVSFCVLCVMCVAIYATWTENYGDATANISESFKSAYVTLRTDRKVLYLGMIQSLFEASMYVFVLEWTPALTPAHSDLTGATQSHRGSIPHGIIFATFMVAIMIGSSLFKVMSRFTSIESFMRVVLLVSALSLVVPIIFPSNTMVIYGGFIVFEACVGVFWPSMGTMRGKYVPEETRATIMNCFRILLNLIVVIILLQDFSMVTLFSWCSAFLLLAVICQQFLYRVTCTFSPSQILASTQKAEIGTEDI